MAVSAQIYASAVGDHWRLERYRRERRPEDREALVLRFLPLARHLAHRYSTAGEREDLEQVAALGLVKAVDRFDPSRGSAFTSFAVPTILGELKRHFRDRGWAVRPPRSVQELAGRVDAAVERLTVELGRAPTADELALRCDATVEEVLEARAAATAHYPVSLDQPVNDDGTDTLLSGIGGEDPGYDRAEQAAELSRLLAQLPARERTVLRLRFEDELVQREISQLLGVSQMQVSRLIAAAIKTLQRNAAIEATRQHARA
jgi:RNA polymerase sigma-B factor